MAYLYILSEGERDELFYDLIAERVAGFTFERPSDFRLRHGANWKTALAGGRLLLNRVKHWNEPQDVAVILAIDNDRAPGHPGSLPHPRPLVGYDLKKPPRYPAVKKMVTDALRRRPQRLAGGSRSRDAGGDDRELGTPFVQSTATYPAAFRRGNSSERPRLLRSGAACAVEGLVQGGGCCTRKAARRVFLACGGTRPRSGHRCLTKPQNVCGGD